MVKLSNVSLFFEIRESTTVVQHTNTKHYMVLAGMNTSH